MSDLHKNHKEGMGSLLRHYSASAILFAGGSINGYSQVYYRDIEPDVLLDEWGDSFHLDIDSDGYADIHFNLSRSTYETWEFGQMNTYEKVIANVDWWHLSFKLAGASDWGFSYWGTFYKYFPYKIESGQVIGSGLNFYNAHEKGDALQNQFLGYRGIFGPVFDFGSWSFTQGYWMPEAIEQFMAFEISNGIDRSQYGWVRLSVLDEGKKLIIYDFAYEQHLGVPIVAGDTSSLATNLNSVSAENDPLLIYPNPGFDLMVLQALPTGLNNLEVRNVTGCLIHKIITDQTELKIDASSWPVGVYFVNVFSDETGLVSKGVWEKQ